MSESITDLIQQASEMLLDRSEDERALIYHIAKLDNEERGAIVLAYGLLRYDEIENE